jgi:hypothetical protein
VESRGHKIQRFRCDNGTGEYNNAEFQKILADSGIRYEPAPPYTQHKNGVAERMIRTLNTKARCMMLDAKVPMKFWAEAIRTAAYIHQRTPTTACSRRTPYESLYGIKPPLDNLRRFGCTAYKYIPKEQRDHGKFGRRSRPCMMLGYVHDTTKIWRLWDFERGLHGGAIECSNVIFDEENDGFHSNDEDIDYDVDFPTNEPDPEILVSVHTARVDNYDIDFPYSKPDAEILASILTARAERRATNAQIIYTANSAVTHTANALTASTACESALIVAPRLRSHLLRTSQGHPL